MTPPTCFARLERHRGIHEARKLKLIDEVRTLRLEMGAVLGVRTFDRQPVARSKVPDLISNGDQEPRSGVAHPSSVAPLEVPDRITKRNYNYFGALNAALAALPDQSAVELKRPTGWAGGGSHPLDLAAMTVPQT